MTQTTEVIYDTDNQFSWDVITRTFIDGVIQTEERIMDNGITRTSQYEEGVLFTRTDVDVNDVMDWQEILYGYYETGELIAKFTTWDNGFVRQAYYHENGQIAQLEMFDDLVTPEGIHPWTYIKREYGESGNLGYEFIQRDNGSTKETRGAGQYVLVEQHDDLVTAEGAYDWTYIETYYHDWGGDKLMEDIQYDNGVHITSSYLHNNRALSEVIKYDGATGEPGIYDWDSIITNFYENGNKSSEIIFYDNDTFSIANYYESGQLKQIELNDGPNGSTGIFDWDAKISLYDEDGNLTRKFVLFDDSDTRDEYFENGVRVRMVQEDDRDDTGLNTAIWDRIETFYNADGTRDERIITYDDGTTKVETYENDVVTSALRTDDPDAFDWDQIIFAYDEAGVVETQTRRMDDTDVIIFLYEEEEIATRLHVDNDDSHSWYLRVTDFAEGGDVITTYDSYDDVPPEYQSLIGVA